MVVALDGKINFVDANSKEILWSFSSGWPIYSSYQIDNDSSNSKVNASESTNDFYIDCGDDWTLYLHSKRFGKVVRGSPFNPPFCIYNYIFSVKMTLFEI